MKNKINDIILVKVTNIVSYGIFIKTEENKSGLIHISEISNKFIRDINDYISLNEEIYAKIIDYNQEKDFLKLSIKNMNYKKEQKEYGIQETISGFRPLAENLPTWIDEKIEEHNKSAL